MHPPDAIRGNNCENRLTSRPCCGRIAKDGHIARPSSSDPASMGLEREGRTRREHARNYAIVVVDGTLPTNPKATIRGSLEDDWGRKHAEKEISVEE